MGNNMQDNMKFNIIADAVIIEGIFSILGPRISVVLIFLVCIFLTWLSVFLMIDPNHLEDFPGGDGLQGGWDGLQYWYWDRIDRIWVPESIIADILVSENRITDERIRRYKLSDFERSRYYRLKYYGGSGFDEDKNIKIKNERIKVVIPVKAGKEIWEERKKEIAKEKGISRKKEEIKRQEKINEQIEQWRQEAREKLNM